MSDGAQGAIARRDRMARSHGARYVQCTRRARLGHAPDYLCGMQRQRVEHGLIIPD